jgi:hypothetical protein
MTERKKEIAAGAAGAGIGATLAKLMRMPAEARVKDQLSTVPKSAIKSTIAGGLPGVSQFQTAAFLRESGVDPGNLPKRLLRGGLMPFSTARAITKSHGPLSTHMVLKKARPAIMDALMYIPVAGNIAADYGRARARQMFGKMRKTKMHGKTGALMALLGAAGAAAGVRSAQSRNSAD